jgi:hypothetical protein
MLPILFNHDRDKPIGWLRVEGDRLFVEFKADMSITREMFFEIFGNAGMLEIEADKGDDDVIVIRKAQILEFSWSPMPASPRMPS